MTYSLRLLSLIPVPIRLDHPLVSPYLVCLTVLSFYWRIWLTVGQLTPQKQMGCDPPVLRGQQLLVPRLGWRWCYRRCCGVGVQALRCSRLAGEWTRKSNASCNFKFCRHWLFSSLPLAVKPIFLRCARRKREPLIINISYENTIFIFICLNLNTWHSLKKDRMNQKKGVLREQMAVEPADRSTGVHVQQ